MALAAKMFILGRDDFPNSQQMAKKSRNPCSNFAKWRVLLPGEQSNPRSRQDIYCFPNSRIVFWSNPTSREYPSRPCSALPFLHSAKELGQTEEEIRALISNDLNVSKQVYKVLIFIQ